MVDFNKLLENKSKPNETNPMLIFKDLDKDSDKTDLRRTQETILNEWYEQYQDRKDTIVKLHTGQGKTLVGLLMLQSSMNAELGPSVYLCPDTYLVSQTIKQAKSFGIKTVEMPDSSIPIEFLNSQAILVTTCSKLFNGLTKFGVVGTGKEPVQLGSIVMDDAHACIDIIRSSFSVTIPRIINSHERPLYQELWNIFQESLMRQGAGTCMDVIDGSYSTMAVPYWIWYEKINDVLSLLKNYKTIDAIKYPWNFIKNTLINSTCIFSGKSVQISPRLLPIDLLPSFTNAKRRIFLSATLNEDAFLVKDLNLEPSSVVEPLTLKDVTWSGERMILIPFLLDTSLTRELIINWLSRFTEKHGNFGVMSLVPSNKLAEDWTDQGGNITNVKNLEQSIVNLKTSIENKTARNVTILVNKYDGVDLPDSICRILCLDSMPSHVSLIDKYYQEMRPDSFIIRRQIAQRLEQGIGRAIRSISDWSIIIITGNDVTNFVSERTKREFLSNETKMQIGIAEQLTDKMKEEEGHKLKIIEDLVMQCINRDDNWRAYYREKMKKVELNSLNNDYLELSKLEREAELKFLAGQYQAASDIIQSIIDNSNEEDVGWYFQLMATYLYPLNLTDSMDKQIKAFSKNNRLHRPEKGITYSKLKDVSTTREELIIDWIKQHESHSSLLVKLFVILDGASFTSQSNTFEDAIKQIGELLGYGSDRPEKTTGTGPDNLWHISGKQFWIISCKNRVKMDRNVIHKKEASQLNTDIAWFKETYDGCKGIPVMIHPTNILDSSAFLTETSYAITKGKLDLLKKNIVNFYNSFQTISLNEIPPNFVKEKLREYHLDNYSLTKNYLERITNL